MGEFELIDKYFKFSGADPEVSLGVGDDCALLELAAGMQWAISCDLLVKDRHFFADVDPFLLGQKALAVNLSDLAACGARPRAFTLSLSIPSVDEPWLEGFSRGLAQMSSRFECPLVGGDTTQGPLLIGITVMGEVPRGQALLRRGAQAGDDLYVSGTLGDARAALLALQGQWSLPPNVLGELKARLESPTPRVALGQRLRGLASAAMDLSDGLNGDLEKMMKASGMRALVKTDWIQQSAAMSPALQTLSFEQRLEVVASGGDDYELLFAAPKSCQVRIQALSDELQLPLTRVGEVMEGVLEREGSEPQALNSKTVVFLDHENKALALKMQSFDHFL